MTITTEELHMFHGIDRELYARLVRTLGRDTRECMKVMAMWIWLERMPMGLSNSHLVMELLKWSDFMINAIADETVFSLRYINIVIINSHIGHGNEHQPDFINIHLLHLLTKGFISFRFFHDNATAVLQGVSKLVEEVCEPVFDDINNNPVSATPSMAVIAMPLETAAAGAIAHASF